jgi:hypothetical protein
LNMPTPELLNIIAGEAVTETTTNIPPLGAPEPTDTQGDPGSLLCKTFPKLCES